MVRYLNERETAEMTGISVAKLRKDRKANIGIPFSKIGKMIRYDIQDIVKFMDEKRSV